MSEWLDSWTTKRQLPRTFQTAMRWATRTRHLLDPRSSQKAKLLPYEDSMYIMRHGKKAWREWAKLRETHLG